MEIQSRARKSRNAMQVSRTNRPAVKMGDAVAHLEGLGVNTEGIRGRASTRKRGRSLGPAAGDDDDGGGDDGMDVEGEGRKRVRFLFPCVFFLVGGGFYHVLFGGFNLSALVSLAQLSRGLFVRGCFIASLAFSVRLIIFCLFLASLYFCWR